MFINGLSYSFQNLSVVREFLILEKGQMVIHLEQSLVFSAQNSKHFSGLI